MFFDDILVYSKNWNEHLLHLHTVLTILQQNKFYIKKSKCTFGKTYVEYIGYIITADRVQVDLLKIEAMKTWPKPGNQTILKDFLELTGYYRKFVKNYGKTNL